MISVFKRSHFFYLGSICHPNALPDDFRGKQLVGWQIKLFTRGERPFCDTERFVSRGTDGTSWETPLNSSQAGQLPKNQWQSSLKRQKSPADLLGSLPSCIDTGQRKWWSVEERTSPGHITCTITPTEEFEVADYPSERYRRMNRRVVPERGCESWRSVQIPRCPALINALCVRLPLAFFQGAIASVSTQDKIKKEWINKASVYSLYRNSSNRLLEDFFMCSPQKPAPSTYRHR